VPNVISAGARFKEAYRKGKRGKRKEGEEKGKKRKEGNRRDAGRRRGRIWPDQHQNINRFRWLCRHTA